MNVYMLQAPGVSPSDWVIATVTRGPLTVLDILAFIMRGDTNIDGNLTNILTPFISYWLIIKNDWLIANIISGHHTFFYCFWP